MARSKLNAIVISAANRHHYGAVYWRESCGIIRFYDRHDKMIHRVKKQDIFMHLCRSDISALLNDLAQHGHYGRLRYGNYSIGLCNQSQMMLPLYEHAKEWIANIDKNDISPAVTISFYTQNTLNNTSLDFKIPFSYFEGYINGFIKAWK